MRVMVTISDRVYEEWERLRPLHPMPIDTYLSRRLDALPPVSLTPEQRERLLTRREEPAPVVKESAAPYAEAPRVRTPSGQTARDLTGRTYGYYLVVGRAEPDRWGGRWLVKCSRCGLERTMAGSNLHSAAKTPRSDRRCYCASYLRSAAREAAKQNGEVQSGDDKG